MQKFLSKRKVLFCLLPDQLIYLQVFLFSRDMKTLLLVLYVFVATAAAVPSQPQAAIAIPEKCEDVLAVKVSVTLRLFFQKSNHLTAQKSFPLRISSVNVTKSTGTASLFHHTKQTFYVAYYIIQVCNKLKSIALSIKLKTGIVKDAVVDAVKKGKNTTEDIYNSVKTFYLEKIKDKQCQDFLKVEVDDNFMIKSKGQRCCCLQGFYRINSLQIS